MERFRSRLIKVAFIVTALPMVIISTRIITASERLILFTPQEAEQLRLSDTEWKRKTFRLAEPVPKGPVISLEKPVLTDTTVEPPYVETSSPVNLVVLFKERNAPVDMNSLQVFGKKGILKLSLTERLKPYLKGTSLEAPDVHVPKGRFLVEVLIQDVDGQKTQKSYRLWIMDEIKDAK